MLSKFAPVVRGVVSRPRALPAFSAVQFHSARVLLDAKTEKDAASTEPSVNKVNPQHAPDNFEPWRNAGYSNLAPRGWKEWSDLPAPYKYYDVKLDPKDVENPGLAWKLMTNWRTAIPITTLLALPAFVYEVVVIDERFELMLIFWSTMAVFASQFGGAFKKSFTDQIDAIRNELLGAEKKYNAALEHALDVHRKGEYLIDHLKAINAQDRAIKAVEAAARTRQIKIEQRNKYRDMLDYLVTVSESREGELMQDITSRTRVIVEKTLASSKDMQQKLIEDAITTLKTGERGVEVVPELFEKTFNDTCDAVDAELSNASTLDAKQKEMFSKRFEFPTVVTEAMLKKAKADPSEWAQLVGKTGGVKPEVGTPIVVKSPLEYVY